MVSGPSAPPARNDQLCLSVGLNSRTGIPRASVWQSHDVSTQEERAARFRALHEEDPFVIPNPWDAGSARVLESLGFQALATTSSGFAFTLGRLDGSVTLDEIAAHVESLVAAVEVPISVDLENGYGPEARDAALAVTRAAEVGAVGGSIEVRQVCEAVSKPVNVLARPGLTVAEIVEAGAQRISVGGSLTWTAVQAFADAAIAIRDRGSFEGLGDGSVVRDWLS